MVCHHAVPVTQANSTYMYLLLLPFSFWGFGHTWQNSARPCFFFCICHQSCSAKGDFLWQPPLHSDQQLLHQLEQLCLGEDSVVPTRSEATHVQREDIVKKRSSTESGSALHAHLATPSVHVVSVCVCVCVCACVLN